MQTFSEFLVNRDPSILDEGFWDSLRQSFSQSYQTARGNPEDDQNLSKYAAQAIPALKSAAGEAKKYADKLGIPLPLATAVIASGIVGGPAAIPFAALMYFVRQPINKIAGKAFDIGAQKLGLMPKPDATVTAPTVPTAPKYQMPAISGDGVRAQLAHTDNLTFGQYLTLVEAGYIDLDEGWGDWAGSMLGKAAGFVSGKAVKYGSNVANMLKNAAMAIGKFASENKLAVAKVAFLMGVGALVGAGVGAAVNKASAAIHGVQQSGVAHPQDVQDVANSVGADAAVDAKSQAVDAASTKAQAAVDAKTQAADAFTAAKHSLPVITSIKQAKMEIIAKIKSGEVNDYDTLQQAMIATKQKFHDLIKDPFSRSGNLTSHTKELFDDKLDLQIMSLAGNGATGNAAEIAKKIITNAGGTPDLEKLNQLSRAISDIAGARSRPLLPD